uniref:Sodium/calcium exchanger membrane region domain-containing protein n=1 Tax=Glossina morsitans morsitans TaxID=37546 RepID=A0ABK9NGX8_GLOMM
MSIQVKFYLYKERLEKFKLNFWSTVLLCVITLIFLGQLLLILLRNSKQDRNNSESVMSVHLQRNLLTKDVKANQCTMAAILQFPEDGLTRPQRLHGWIIVHIVLTVYGFWILAIVCDDYLIPCIQKICKGFTIDHDIIGATIMAAAVSTPELFINCVGTFVTKGDIGESTVVGSAIFNMLAVPACCGLFLGNSLKLDWWPITRDCLSYTMVVLTLLGIVVDGRIMWYESLCLVIGYFVYMLVMYHHKSVAYKTRQFILGNRHHHYQQVTEFTPLILKADMKGLNNGYSHYSLACEAHSCLNLAELGKDIPTEIGSGATHWSCDKPSCLKYLMKWPIILILSLTIPKCHKHPRLKYITFLFSILWIGGISYLMAFTITIIGDTLGIPDAVMGLTILAIGMTIPEAVSSISVIKQGYGVMGLSNSLGSNTFSILLSLGLPWLVKSIFLPEIYSQHLVVLRSSALMYSCFILLISIFILYTTFLCNRFTLNSRTGYICLFMYAMVIIAAILLELNIFFSVNLPACRH